MSIYIIKNNEKIGNKQIDRMVIYKQGKEKAHINFCIGKMQKRENNDMEVWFALQALAGCETILQAKNVIV